ncbi:MAG: tetratricopeptide repeat protein [Clostridiales bacterium]|nr:tetratricopeptide repeat protein [Clostridiales bacterium]
MNFIYNKLAYLAWDDKDWKAARDCYEKALDIAEQMATTRNVPSDWGDLCISYNSLGNLAREEGDRQTAWNWCEKALEIAERLVNTRKSIEDYDYLAITLLSLAHISASEQECKRLAQRGLAISDKLYKQTGLPKFQKYFDDFNKIYGRAESGAYDQKGDAALERGDWQAAQGWYEKALEVRKQQEKACSTSENQRNLRVSYFKLGIVSQEARDVQTAQFWYEKSLDNAERLAENSGTYEDYHDLIVSLWGLSGVCSPEQEQVRMAQRALSIAETLYKQNGEPRYQSLAEKAHEMLDALLNSVHAVSVNYDQQGDSALERGDRQTAREWYEKAIGIWEQLAEMRGTPEDWQNLIVGYHKLGDLVKKDGALQAARGWYEKSVDVQTRLAETQGDLDDWWNLSVSDEKLGDLALEDENWQTAQDWHRKALAIREQLVKARGALEDWRGLSISYERLGHLAWENGDRNGCREWHEKSLPIVEQLAKSSGTIKAYDNLTATLYILAIASDAQQERRNYAQRGCSIAETLYKQTGDPRYQSFMDGFHKILKPKRRGFFGSFFTL